MKSKHFFTLLSLLSFLLVATAEQCGRQAGGALCPGGICCSQFGWCGSTPDYCNPPGCQSQCNPPTPGGSDITNLITRSMFEDMLRHRNEPSCPARNFYTYDSFISAARTFNDFATTGDDTTRRREIAAFFAQTSHETTGGWQTAPDGPYAWGYCFLREQGSPGDYCVPNDQWRCVPGRQYFGRGPMQISYNYNYGPCGRVLGVDLLNNPDLVITDPVIAFRSAMWFWMTPQSPKPSCHDVITGRWTPSGADRAANRLPGFGAITNIINGGLECGHGNDARVQDRIGFYRRYCDILRVGYGDNLDCGNQRPFGSGLLVNTM